MADEYSDEEFAHDDAAEPAYEAEFDDDEADELHDETAVYEDEYDDDESNGDGGGAVTFGAASAYQESYDAEFDTPDAGDEPAAAALDQQTKADFELAPMPEQNKTEVGTSSELVVPADTNTAGQHGSLEDSGSRATEGHAVGLENCAPVEKPDPFPRRSAPARRSSEPRMMAVVPEIERCMDPELQARLIRRSSSPRVRPSPIARLHSVGELSAAAPGELGVPTNEITEEAALLVRRSSSTRTRPAPIARLPSVGEFSPAAPDELEVPINGITEEAAAVGNAVATDGTSQSLVRRHSSHSFVPRLPSLRELDGDLAAKLEVMGIESHTQDNEEDEDESGNDDSDDSERDDENKDGGHAENCEDGGVVRADEVAAAKKSDPDVNVEAGITTGDQANHPTKQPMDRMEVKGDADDEKEKQETATIIASEGCNENDLSERPVSRTSEEESSARSSPQPISEHLTDDDFDLQVERLQKVMAEVEATESAEIAIVEDLDDGTDYTVTVDDDSGHKTQQLLNEAHSIIAQHPAKELLSQSSEKGDRIRDEGESDAIERYGCEDLYFADGYDEDDQELMDGAYYDSDHEDLDEDRSRTSILNAACEVSTLVPTIQAADVQSSPGPKPVGGNTPALQGNSAKTVVQKVTSPNQRPTGSPKKPQVPQTSARLPSPKGKVSIEKVQRRTPSQGSPRATVSSVNARPTAPVRQPDTPTLKPKAPVPRQKASTPRQSHRIASTPAPSLSTTVSDLNNTQARDTKHVNQAVDRPVRDSIEKSSSPSKSDRVSARPSSPTRTDHHDHPESPSRKAPVFKQAKPAKQANVEGSKKKLKPVKCPPNLRIDLPHVDKEKREWLLLNMFRHGDNIDKYDPFIPTTTPEQTVALHLSLEALKRPLSALQIYGEAESQLPRASTSRGAYTRHGGRKIVDRPVDPRIREREQNWISSTPSVSSIPQYDSILDKYCKTVTSPTVQRRIYETRMDDLSPRLAMVLEKRAFKEWKHNESDGFGAVSNSYKTAIVPTKTMHSSSSKTLHTPRPPQSSSQSAATTLDA